MTQKQCRNNDTIQIQILKQKQFNKYHFYAVAMAYEQHLTHTPHCHLSSMHLPMRLRCNYICGCVPAFVCTLVFTTIVRVFLPFKLTWPHSNHSTGIHMVTTCNGRSFGFVQILLLSQVFLLRYNSIKATTLCRCIFPTQYTGLYIRFHCFGNGTKTHVSMKTVCGNVRWGLL